MVHFTVPIKISVRTNFLLAMDGSGDNLDNKLTGKLTVHRDQRLGDVADVAY